MTGFVFSSPQQEPARTHDELMNGLKYVRPGNGFEPSFPFFKKIDVNGENEHPLYTYLKVRTYIVGTLFSLDFEGGRARENSYTSVLQTQCWIKEFEFADDSILLS